MGASVNVYPTSLIITDEASTGLELKRPPLEGFLTAACAVSGGRSGVPLDCFRD